jgi:PAS domain S-box-containing protein
MYAHLTSRIAALMNVEMCGVLLHDADQDALVTQLPFFGVPDAVVNVYRIPLQEGTPARAIFNAREWWFSNSVRTDDLVRQLTLNGLAEALGVRTTALVPLTIGDRRYGVVQVANKRDGSGFNETDLRLLVVFASQVAVVVESARLRQEERDRNEQLGGLQQITRTLSVLNDPAELYAQVVERVSRLMSVNVCGILLHDAEHHLLVGQQPFVGIDPALVRYYQVPFVPESKLFQRINRRGFWISNNLAEDTAIRDSGVDKMAMMLALQHSLLVPLDANGQRLGFIQVANKLNGLGFTEEDARSLITLAEQSASLLADARTYRNTRYRADVAAGMQRLAEIVSSSTTLDQLASGAASVIRALLNCDLTTLWILNEATGELRAQPEWASGIEGQLPQPLTLDVYAPGNETSPVISRRPFISNDVLNDGRVLPLYRAVAERFQVLSVMQVPLVARDHVLGELTAAHRAPERDFTSDDLRLAQAICAQLAAGLERLQLYQATDQTMQARVRQLDTINRISAELTETTNLDEVLEIIRAELGRAADSDLATVVWLKPSADWLTADDPILERRLGHTRGFLELAPIEHRAIRNGGMVIVNDYDLSDIDAMPIRARSAIAAPVFYGDTPVGALHLFSEKADALPPQVQDFVRALASQATIGIGNALRLRQQTERSELVKQRAEQFTHIFELGRMINAEGGTESVLNAIARGITEVVGFNIAVISLVERHTTIMQVAAYAGVPEADLPALLKDRPKLAVIEQLLQPRYRISNAYFLPAEDPTLQAVEQEVGFIEPKLSYARTGTGAWDPHDALIVPLRNPSGEMIGMISVDDPRDGKRPSLPVIETLEVFANQAVAAVENYRLLQAFQGEADSAREERDRLERLYLVAGEIQRATDVPTRLKVVADSICAVGWGRVAITLRDAKLDPRETITAGFNEEDEAAFRMNVLPGMVWGPRLSDPEFRRLRIGQAYYIRYDSAWVTENKRIAGISAGTSGEHFIPTDPAYPPDKWHPLDTLYLPLYGLDRSRLIGIITMDRPQDGRVPVEDTLRSIELFAAQAASAIENTRLYDETVRAATQEARINEMMEAVASTLELDEIIEGIAGGMRDMIAFTRMSVMLVDEDRDEFEVRRVTLGMRGEIAIDSGEPIPVEDTAVGLAVRDAKTTLYHIADANRLPALHDLKTWWMTGERTTLIIPMVAGGRVTGALHMGSELSDAFGFEEQIPLLSRMANLAAIAIENAQLFQQSIDRERFSTAVGRIGQAVSTSALTDKTSVLRFICEETVNLLDVSGAYIWLVDGNDLVGIAAHGLSAEDITNHRQPLSNTSIEAAIVRERAPHMITGVQKAESQFSHTAISVPSVYSILGVPLLREDMPIGVMICVQADARALFTDNDIEKMNTLAVQASIALESARLYDDVGTRAQQLSVLTEVSGELAATLEMDAVVQMLLDRLGTILLFDRVTLWLRRGDRLVIRSARGFDDVEGLIGVEAEIADSALFRDLASRGQVLNIPDISKDERFPFSDASPTRSWLGVSLVSRGNLIGLLVMEKSEVAYYSPTMEQLALTFANQAAISLENARLYQEATRTAAENTRLYNETALRARKLDQQAKRLALLNQVSNALTQSPDVENIFDVTLREIVTILGVERGTAILFEGRPQGRFVYEFPRGDSPPEEADIAILLNDPSPLLEELRRVMLPTIVQNVTTDPRVSAARDSLVKRSVLSILIVPMVIGGQMIGTLNFEATETNRDFSPEQLEVTQTIAAQAVVAVQNANLFEQSLLRTRELETLFEATQATTSTLNLQEVLSNTANQMLFSLQVDACQILFWNDVEDHLLVQLDMTPMGVNERGDVPGTSYDLTLYPMRERALKARQMLQMRTSSGAESLTDAERSLMQRRNAAARILLPLSVREQTIGLIEIESHDPFRNFTVSDVRMARTLASQAAVAIDNARLNTETSVKLVELLEINELSTSLAKAIELEQIFDVVRKRLPALIKAQIWVLAYLGEDKLTVSYPIALREGQPMNLPNHLVGDDEISFVINRRSAQRLAGHEIEEVLRNLKISRRILQVRCFLGVPLVSGDEVVGALILGDEANIRAFNLDVQRVLSTIGAQIAIAIQNARLFARSRQFAAELEQAVKDRTSELQEERDRIQFLYRITTDLALSLDLEVVLKRALELMAEAVDADMGAILGIDSLSESLTYRTALNMPGINLEDNTPLSQHEGLAGWVIQSQQSVIVDDVQADPRWLRLSEADDDPRSAMAVLLESNEDIYGVVMLYSRTQGKFDDNQLRLVAAACNQVASAMNNAELYGLIREQAERLGMMVRREQVDSTKNLAIVESIADGVMVADAMGDITQFNSAAERILDVRRADLIGRSIGDLGGLYSSTGGKRWFEEMQRWIAAPTAHRPDSNFAAQVDLDNGKTIQVILSPVLMSDQFLGTVSVIRDVTREIEVDRMKSEFVATVSHELRTPMTSIKGYADLLLIGAAGTINEQQQKFLGTIKTNADRLSALVNDLLDISRIDRGNVKLNFQPIDVSEVIEGTVRHLNGRIQNDRKPMSISNDVPGNLPAVRADFDKLTQIVNNLGDNAFNYTYPNGEIHLTAYADSDSVVLCVKDSGIGIPKDKQDRIWNRFFRDEEQPLVLETSGTGLGLAIVREYVEMHDGHIWLESEPGQGTTFFVRIPTYTLGEGETD